MTAGRTTAATTDPSGGDSTTHREHNDANDNLHKNKTRELETQVLVSSLLLGVSGAGLFATTGLVGKAWEPVVIASFCVAVFCYMAAAIISSLFLLPFLSTKFSSATIK